MSPVEPLAYSKNLSVLVIFILDIDGGIDRGGNVDFGKSIAVMRRAMRMHIESANAEVNAKS
jgi:hypothetical protein